MNGTSPAWIAFEDEVYRRVARLLSSRRLLIDPKRATAHRRKKYYSPPREAEIEFEIAIEAFDAGATEPSLIWVWECKDNSASGRRVEVSDIEVLSDKVDQLGRARVKASLVSRNRPFVVLRARGSAYTS